MQNSISSLQNPLVKQILQLQEKSRTRKKLGLFVVEGIREITLAVKANYQIDTLLFDASIVTEEAITELSKQAVKTVSISKDVYKKLAYRATTEGVIAIVKNKKHDLSSIQLSTKNPLILVAEAPEKPGNIGALLRTADAANIDAVIVANPKTDMYNPNIIRSSVGCVFTNTIATGSTTEVIQFLKENNINIYGAALNASVNYTTIDYTLATAIVMGTEATGLTEEWLKNTTQNIIIPMQGEIDSMNVSVSAAILIFEAKRQRNFQ